MGLFASTSVGNGTRVGVSTGGGGGGGGWFTLLLIAGVVGIILEHIVVIIVVGIIAVLVIYVVFSPDPDFDLPEYPNLPDLRAYYKE